MSSSDPDPAVVRDPRAPRIGPGDAAEIGRLNDLISRALGIVAGSTPPNLFRTLGRHRRLFRPWLRFAGALMPGGLLPRADSELVILRVAHLRDCAYERVHHEHLAAQAGLDPAQIAATALEAPAGESLSPDQRLLLEAVDALHADGDLADAVWARLATRYSEAQLIELVMLVGHYEMLATTLNTLRVVPDVFRPQGPPAIVSALARRFGS